MSSLISKLSGYFPGKYGSERLEALDRFVENIDQKDHEAIYDWITENRAVSSPVGKKDLKDACVALGIPFRSAEEAAPQRLECLACGTSYLFLLAVDTWQEVERGIHCRCPCCGMPGADQLKALAVAAMQEGRSPEWFGREIAHYHDKWHNGQWNNGAGGNFWDSARERQALENHRKKVFGMTKDLAKEKSYVQTAR